MEIKIKGTLGQSAKIAMQTLPVNGTVVIKGAPPNGEIFYPSSDFQNLGVFPCSVDFCFLFHRRPWSIILEFENMISFSTSNNTIGLSDTEILTPDILKITTSFIIA